MDEYAEQDDYRTLLGYQSQQDAPSDPIFHAALETNASMAIAPNELDILAKIGVIKPLGNGSFSLSSELSSSDRPSTFRASVDQDAGSFTLSGDTKGLRTVEAMLGDLRAAQSSDEGGMLSRSLSYGRDGYGAEVSEDREGGRGMKFQTPDFGISRYTRGGLTDTRVEGERWNVGHMRDAEQGYSETTAGMRFGEKRPGEWQTEVGGSADNMGARRAYLNAVKEARKPTDWQTTVGAAIDNRGEHRFDIRAQKRF